MRKFLLAGTLALTAITGAATAQPRIGLPEVPRIPDGLLGSQPAEGVTWVTCLVIEVAAFEDRSHVRCSNGQGGGTASLPPEFIAVDIRANPGLASSLVTGGARMRAWLP